MPILFFFEMSLYNSLILFFYVSNNCFLYCSCRWGLISYYATLMGFLAQMDDHVYIGSDKRVFLDGDKPIDGEVTFDLSEDQIDVLVKVELPLLRSCTLEMTCGFVLMLLLSMLYLHNLYNIDRISIYAIKVTGQTTSSVHVQIPERVFSSSTRSILANPTESVL